MSSLPEKTSTQTSDLSRLLPATAVEQHGRIVQAVGTCIRASGVNARIGERCVITDPESSRQILADVVGIEGKELLLYPLGSLHGLSTNSAVQVLPAAHYLAFSSSMLGGVYDGFGKPFDSCADTNVEAMLPLDAEAPSPLKRQGVDEVFATGVRCIDSLLTTGVGQRMGIFAAAGGGKSTLLSMLAKSRDADVVVLALIGERGREVREFIDICLSDENRSRAVLVVATSDRPAMERVLAAKTATTLAEAYRAQGKRVLLLMDSVTRYARALREIGLSIGEPPVRRGFPPSVFTELPRLFERAGNDDRGSITAFYTILSEDEQNNDPIAEEVRSILDGHIVLSSKLGESGHYPAIDVLASKSRLYMSLADEKQQRAAVRIRQLLTKYQDIEFLVQMGEYKEGTDPLADEAISKRDAISAFLCQAQSEHLQKEQSLQQLQTISGIA